MVRYHVTIESKGRVDDLDHLVRRNMVAATRAAAESLMHQGRARIETENIPGPPLSPATVRIERAVLERNGGDVARAAKPLQFTGHDEAQTRVEAHRTAPDAAEAQVVVPVPPGRPSGVHALLERGGVNEEGRIVPPRPLWTSTTITGMAMALRAMADVFTRALDRLSR